MATTDPKRAALVRALMERDLYEMLDIPRDADDAMITAAIATRTEWVEETPMRAAARDAEMHWLGWSERALITDPEIRTDYDAALARKAAAVDRAVESRVRVRKLHAARDQLAKREAQRVVPIVIDPPKPAPAPRKRKAAVKKVDAGDSAHAVLQATQVTDVEEALRGLEGADGNVAVAIAFADRAVEIDDSAATLTRAGASLRGIGETDRAIALLRRAIDADPQRTDARISLITALSDSGDLPAAEAAGRSAVAAAPADGGVQYAFGKVLVELGLLEEAETALSAAQSLGNPRAADELRTLRESYSADGDVDGVERVEEISYPAPPVTNDPAVAEPGTTPAMEAEPVAPADEPGADVTDES